MKVSVIIPTQNRPQLLLKAIASIEQQTLLPEEIIVIDDASQEDYWQEIKSQIAPIMQSRAVWQRLPRASGASIARNKGAEVATGDILMFLDDDDTWTPDKIANQVKIFQDNPEIGLVYAGRRVVDEQGQLLFVITPKIQGKIYTELLQSNCVGVTSSVAIRKEVFQAVGGFDPQMPGRQDYDLWVRIARITDISFDPNPTVNWTVHSQPGKQMNSRPELYKRAVELFINKYQQDLAQLPFLKKRKAYASHYTMLADKYGQVGSWRQYWYVLRSLILYPSAAALARLLPYSFYLQLRKFN